VTLRADYGNPSRLQKKLGVKQSQIVIDPGIGFGKSYSQNYELLARLRELAKLGYPVMIGTSRKGFLGATLAKNGKTGLRRRTHVGDRRKPWRRAF